jgi:hypothetical protein
MFPAQLLNTPPVQDWFYWWMRLRNQKCGSMINIAAVISLLPGFLIWQSFWNILCVVTHESTHVHIPFVCVYLSSYQSSISTYLPFKNSSSLIKHQHLILPFLIYISSFSNRNYFTLSWAPVAHTHNPCYLRSLRSGWSRFVASLGK